jgi:hypothetical protein
VTFDEIAVVAVHDANQLGETRGTQRMESPAECSTRLRQLCDQVAERCGDLVEQAGLDAVRWLQTHGHSGRHFADIQQSLYIGIS